MSIFLSDIFHPSSFGEYVGFIIVMLLIFTVTCFIFCLSSFIRKVALIIGGIIVIVNWSKQIVNTEDVLNLAFYGGYLITNAIGCEAANDFTSDYGIRDIGVFSPNFEIFETTSWGGIPLAIANVIVVYIFYSFASQTFMLWIGIIAIVIGALLIIYPLICFIFGWY